MIDLSAYVQTLTHQKIAVFGLGVSGLSTVRALVKAGAKVCAWDDNKAAQNKARELGAEIVDLTQSLDGSYDFLVLSPGVPLTHPAPHAVVMRAQDSGLEIICDVELLHRADHGLKTIGITGTNGKSTTTALMAHVLNEGGVHAIAAGNIGTPVLDLDLSKAEVLVLELSSYQLDLCTSFKPDIAVLLNITPDHLDRHGDMAGYTKAKARIFGEDNAKIIGVDTPHTAALCEGYKDVMRISVEGAESDLSVVDGTLKRGENDIADISNFDTLKGAHNYQNAACVYAALKEIGLEDAEILPHFKTYAGLPHRQYKCGALNGVIYINDSKATNAMSAGKALGSFEDIYWIVGGRAKEGGLSGLEEFMSRVNKAYLIGEAAPQFEKWCLAHYVDYEMSGDIQTALNAAHRDAQNYKKGTVLLAPACASWDQFASFEKRGEAFMDGVDALLNEYKTGLA